VIAFLEDDDVYVSNRLEEVYKAFTSYDRLVYFHNSQKIIDDKGNLLERSPLPTSKNLFGGSTIVIDINELQKLAKRYKIEAADLVPRLRALADFKGIRKSRRRQNPNRGS
jgi:hypothetical protein